MKLGVMQPYFLPYIGYWQLINAVDEYVLVDNLNYIKNGFVNRNFIIMNGEPFRFGISVKKASQNKFINEHIHGMTESEVNKLLETLRTAYAKAPYFEETYNHVRGILEFGLTPEGRNLADFLIYSIRVTADKLGIKTPILRSSTEVKLDGEYRKEKLVVAYCKKRNADEYYNAIGGTKLYFQNYFRENDISLKFVKTNEELRYKQFTDDFVPSLSILDVMMFNSPEQIKDLLGQFTLIDGYESFEDYEKCIENNG
ncbi:WbqC family protein [Butyrivibrio sp. WCD3002]|uniref:WbqC family protein n=1 Tax=Butyrivibrio sp. WCD3002 TaxID=1280676 RepID=UPI000429FB22|nr:WbqC family protein [Butyrivibrio sp. WCD3002]